MLPLLLIGAGGHAVSCVDVLEREGRFDIVGLVGLTEEVGKRLLDYEILGDESALPALRGRAQHALVTVGQIKSSTTRERLFDLVTTLGYDTPTVVSPRAHVSTHAVVGSGTIVMHDAVVNARARLGKNCIVNTRALIEHDACVGDHCHVSTGAILNGGVTVGARTFVGSGAVVMQSVTIEEGCVVPMGAVVRHDQRGGRPSRDSLR